MAMRIDLSDVRRFERDLGALYKNALPYAVVDANNGIAFDMRGSWNGRLRNSFTLRNRFTERSIRVDKASIADSRAIVGSVAPYMKTQEFGAKEKKKGRYGVAIPTNEARVSKDHKKLVRKHYQVQNITILRNGRLQRGPNARKHRNRVAIAQAAAAPAGKRFAFLDFGVRRGIFEVRGSSSKGGRRVGKHRIRMVQDLSHAMVDIPKRPTLAPTVQRGLHRGPSIYVKALQRQIDRQRLFKTRH